jgi:hypothetical protein
VAAIRRPGRLVVVEVAEGELLDLPLGHVDAEEMPATVPYIAGTV